MIQGYARWFWHIRGPQRWPFVVDLPPTVRSAKHRQGWWSTSHFNFGPVSSTKQMWQRLAILVGILFGEFDELHRDDLVRSLDYTERGCERVVELSHQTRNRWVKTGRLSPFITLGRRYTVNLVSAEWAVEQCKPKVKGTRQDTWPLLELFVFAPAWALFCFVSPSESVLEKTIKQEWDIKASVYICAMLLKCLTTPIHNLESSQGYCRIILDLPQVF